MSKIALQSANVFFAIFIMSYTKQYLQYVLSHIIYNGREYEIIDFFNDLVEKVILNMEERGFVIINDINHCIARDKFKIHEDIIMEHGMEIRIHKYYYRFKEYMHPS